MNFDIVGFTRISTRSTPKEIFLMLEMLFTLFDDNLLEFPDLFKVETIGDSYMISAGCPVRLFNNIETGITEKPNEGDGGCKFGGSGRSILSHWSSRKYKFKIKT
jgi:hypothetical protein